MRELCDSLQRWVCVTPRTLILILIGFQQRPGAYTTFYDGP